MERLQAALDKAREKRSNTAVAVTAGTKPRRSNAEVDAAWDRLKRIEIDSHRLVRKRLVALRGGNEATPFDVLRTKVLQLMEAGGWRRLVITSPSPGSGKTTTSANLAISLSRQIDLRVMLLDLDMRRPALARLLEHREEIGVESVLNGSVAYADQARRIGDNLAVSMNYAPAHDPADLFLRQGTSEIIDAIDRTYRPSVMLFDMPPMMVNDDTSAFLRNVDCALIVAEAGVSTLEQIDLCEKELSEQTNVLGVMLNKCRFQSDGYGYYYNYGY